MGEEGNVGHPVLTLPIHPAQYYSQQLRSQLVRGEGGQALNLESPLSSKPCDKCGCLSAGLIRNACNCLLCCKCCWHSNCPVCGAAMERCSVVR